VLALLQRVSEARVVVGGVSVASIGGGLLVFVGVERNDTEAQAERLYERIVGYRIFPDQDDKMNCSVADIGGGLLLVPQFTLPADTAKGMRPSFTPAAAPGEGERLFEHLVGVARTRYPEVGVGRFGAHMAVHLVNDGPATFMLRVAPPAAG